MTINSKIRDLGRRARLPFGVPLDDIFPHDDIHSHLKALFIKAYQDIVSCSYSIGDITTKLQGTVSQRLEIKQAVAECKQMPPVVPPGALLWVIRHFLGLLPVALLPNYTHEKFFSWYHLSRFCKKTFLKYSAVDVNERLLTEKIAKDLLQLPSSHLLLFSVLINFIRLVTRHQKSKNRLNRLAALYLVRYFSSSLFLRPYIPGRAAKIDKQFFPLLLYIVMRWPEIETLFKEKCNFGLKHEYDIPEELINTKEFYRMITRKFDHVSTQTDDIQVDRCLDTISETSRETFDYLKDTAAQTETVILEKPMRCCCKIGSNYESDARGSELSLNKLYNGSYCKIRDDVSELELSKLCQTNSTSSLSRKSVDDLLSRQSRDMGCNTEYQLPIHWSKCVTRGQFAVPKSRNKVDQTTNTEYQTIWKHSFINPSMTVDDIQSRRLSVDETTNTETQPRFSWEPSFINRPSKTIDNSHMKTPTRFVDQNRRAEQGTNTDYQPRFCWVEPNFDNPLKDAESFSPRTFITESEYIYDSYENSTLNLLSPSRKSFENISKADTPDLTRRISKIGWTYTPPKSSSTVLQPKFGLKEENYTLYYNDKELLDREDKENCSTGRNSANTGSKSDENRESVKTKRSAFSISSIKSKLDFLKVFTPKRGKLRSSNSCEEVTNIKYKKMASTKSTTF